MYRVEAILLIELQRKYLTYVKNVADQVFRHN